MSRGDPTITPRRPKPGHDLARIYLQVGQNQQTRAQMPVTRLLTRAVSSCIPRALRRVEAITNAAIGGPTDADIEVLSRRIILPSMPITDEEMARAEFQDRGQKLARQEMWNELSQEIHKADAARLATPGGESAAMLLAFGARGDVVAVAEDSLHENVKPASDGIDALEQMLEDHSGDYACALIVAMAHVDLGWAWRHAPECEVTMTSGVRATKFKNHFDRAESLLAPYCGIAENAPSLAAAQCALMAAMTAPDRRVADNYEDLIDLDPTSPRHMRALGQSLLPSRFGSYQQLEVEARRTASRTGDIWGAGAYAWVYFDALALDEGALEMLDCDFFIEGLQDILNRNSDQHVANLLAAFCAVTMGPLSGETLHTYTSRQKIGQCLSWILSNHLHELHPLIWTQALHSPGLTPPLPSRRALVTEGRQAALRAIALQFADDIADGSSIAFSPAGMYRLPTI